MNSNPSVSVIVPAYNAQKTLKRCLESIRKQSMKDFEVLCINDASTDATDAILESYARKDSRFRVITNPRNLHTGLSKDQALLLAHGEVVVFVDSDDYLDNQYLRIYTDVMRRESLDILVGGYVSVPEGAGGKMVRHTQQQSVWALTTYVVAWSKMYRLDFIRNTNMEFTDLHCLEDMLFNLTGYCSSPRYKVIDYCGYYHCENSLSVTHTFAYSQNHERITEEAYARLSAKISLQSLSCEQRRVLEYTYLANMIHSLLLYNRHCGIRVMHGKYRNTMRRLRLRFPDYHNNPYILRVKLKGQSRRIRFAVDVMMTLNRVGLDRFIYYLAAL